MPGVAFRICRQNQELCYGEALFIATFEFVGLVYYPRILLFIRRLFFELLELGVAAYMQPELDDQCAIIMQHALKEFDLLKAAVEFLALYAIFDECFCGFSVPGA